MLSEYCIDCDRRIGHGGHLRQRLDRCTKCYRDGGVDSGIETECRDWHRGNHELSRSVGDDSFQLASCRDD